MTAAVEPGEGETGDVDASAFDAIVLAGGAGRRMGGVDKALLSVGDASLLDRALAAVEGAQTTVVVGPRRPASAQVVFARETPPGAGPAAALAEGLRHVVSPVVVVVAVDAPFAASAVPRLRAALARHDAAMLVDHDGRRQPLLAAYATDALRRRVSDEPWANRSVRSLVEGLAVVQVEARGDEALDCDTASDLEWARRGSPRADGQSGSGCSADVSS